MAPPFRERARLRARRRTSPPNGEACRGRPETRGRTRAQRLASGRAPAGRRDAGCASARRRRKAVPGGGAPLPVAGRAPPRARAPDSRRRNRPEAPGRSAGDPGGPCAPRRGSDGRLRSFPSCPPAGPRPRRTPRGASRRRRCDPAVEHGRARERDRVAGRRRRDAPAVADHEKKGPSRSQGAGRRSEAGGLIQRPSRSDDDVHEVHVGVVRGVVRERSRRGPRRRKPSWWPM